LQKLGVSLGCSRHNGEISDSPAGNQSQSRPFLTDGRSSGHPYVGYMTFIGGFDSAPKPIP
jgi:hypothetical protein